MALKRKASFSSFASSSVTPFCPQAMGTADSTSSHLHSRTRKRYRNDRPDEQTIYEHTLRLLYSAQKEQISSQFLDEPMSLTPPPSDSESIDPRQQTLCKFFQPVQASSSMRIECRPQNKDSGSAFNAGMIQAQSMDVEFSDNSTDSGSATPMSGVMETDIYVKMNMEVDFTGQDATHEARTWVGGIGWM